MPQPFNYRIAQPQVSTYFDAFRQGRGDRLAGEEEARNKSLAQYLPGALSGDEAAQKQALDVAAPDQQIALSGHFAQMDAKKLAKVKELQAEGAKMAFWADTPDKWAIWNAEGKKRDPNFQEAPFERRGMIIAQAQTVADQIDQAFKEKSYELDRRRTDASIEASRASAAKDRASIAPPQIGPDGKPLPAPPNDKTIDNEQKIRAEFIKGADEFVKVRDAYGRVQASAKDPSAAGDLALIFSYMKILDPGSVVREQEFANAQNAAGVPDQVRNMYNKVLRGERLAPNQRNDFSGRAGKLYKQQLQSFRGTEKLYQGISKGYGFDSARTVPDLSLGVTGDEMGVATAPTSTPIVKTQADRDALPSGAVYVDSADGKRYRKQ